MFLTDIIIMSFFNRYMLDGYELDRIVGIVTDYEMDGWGSNPSRGKIFLFSTTSRPTIGPIQPPIQWVLGTISPGVSS
jgi:hypothetical protein